MKQYGTRLRRFTDHKPTGNPLVLATDHYAVREATTLFRARKVSASEPKQLIKSGMHSRKIGKKAIKSRWAGMPIFTLTLEERATCPVTCHHWRDCYGNKMNWAQRIAHGPELIVRLQSELAALQSKYPKGFIVRLHVLGDFYSVQYVREWIYWLARFPALRVFGYTAWQRNTEIGMVLAGAAKQYWDRFAIRTSDAPGLRSTISVASPADAPAEAIVCPAQTEATECCGTCGLCWQTERQIAFLTH